MNKVSRAALAAVVSLITLHPGSSVAVDAAGPVGDFEAAADVGSPKIAGSAAYNPISQDYTPTAAGTNMWAQRDEFHFVWKKMTGDFILQTRVELILSLIHI